MQPQQPNANYDFIMNPGSAPKKAPLGGNSMAMRLLVVFGGLFILVIIAAVVINLLGNSNKAFNSTAMLAVMQDQAELIRLSSESDDITNVATKGAVATVALSMKSEQASTARFAADYGYKADPKQLGLKQSTRTDSQLADAKSTSTYDKVLEDILKTQLQTYQADLKTAYDSGNQPTKQFLNTNYQHADLLLTKLNAGN